MFSFLATPVNVHEFEPSSLFGKFLKGLHGSRCMVLVFATW